MLTARLFCYNGSLKIGRQISCGIVKYENKSVPQSEKSEASSPQESNYGSGRVFGPMMYNVNNFDRWLLVWIKRFPKKGDVPNAVSREVILQARAKGRIKACIYMMVVTVIGCFLAVRSGKASIERGESLSKITEDWHKEILEKAAEEAKRK